MTHINRTIKATYDTETIKELIAADLRRHGISIDDNDRIKEIGDNQPLIANEYYPFKGYEFEMSEPVQKPVPTPR